MGIPTVSVILPVWNGERFLAEAINSISQQTFADLEILVIDDGSTDRSAAITAGLARADSRIQLVSVEHGGLVAALNHGIHLARAPYLARMDGDDYSLPTRLAKQVAFLEAHPAMVVVGSNLEAIDEEGRSIGAMHFPRHHPDIVAALMGGRAALAHPTVVMRRAAVLEAGCYRSQSFPSEDFDLWLRMHTLGEFANIPEPLLRYRRHRDAVGVRERGRQLSSAARVTDAVRVEQGLRPLKRWAVHMAASVEATYHFECARIALKSGQRLSTARHAAATIRSAPRWLLPYGALAACALPVKSLTFLGKFYARFGGGRS